VSTDLVVKFEEFVREQRANNADLEAVNVQVESETAAEKLAAALVGAGWDATVGQGLVFSREANEMRLVHLVQVEL
jgi:hypothetical protein